MIAEKIMVKNITIAHENELVHDVFEKMRQNNLRMLPIVDEANRVTGVISTFCMMQTIVPSYIASGDLGQISFAPDIGILRSHYDEISSKPIKDVMNHEPLLVNQNDSILSVAAALSAFGRHEYAMVVDDNQHLLGLISAGDILDRLEKTTKEALDA